MIGRRMFVTVVSRPTRCPSDNGYATSMSCRGRGDAPGPGPLGGGRRGAGRGVEAARARPGPSRSMLNPSQYFHPKWESSGMLPHRATRVYGKEERESADHCKWESPAAPPSQRRAAASRVSHPRGGRAPSLPPAADRRAQPALRRGTMILLAYRHGAARERALAPGSVALAGQASWRTAPSRSGGEAEDPMGEGPLRRQVVRGHGAPVPAQHRHGLDPGQRPSRRPEALEAEHRPSPALGRAGGPARPGCWSHRSGAGAGRIAPARPCASSPGARRGSS